MHSQKSKRTSYLLDYNKIGIGLFICATGKQMVECHPKNTKRNELQHKNPSQDIILLLEWNKDICWGYIRFRE